MHSQTNNMKQKKLFSKFGMEPTFYPNFLNFPDIWYEKIYYSHTDGPWLNLMTNIIDQMRGDDIKTRVKHPWLTRKSVNDGSVLEIPTPVYYKWDVFEKNYESLIKKLGVWGFVPSSEVCLESEGGCHLSFSFLEKTMEFGMERTTQAISNLISYVQNHPSILWTFLSPWDNNSSEIALSRCYGSMGKGYFLTHHKTSESTYSKKLNPKFFRNTPPPNIYLNDRVELRFFMMPRNMEECKLHFDFANALLHYIWNETMKDRNIQKTMTQEKLRKYEFSGASDEIQSVCKTIGIDPKRLIASGKDELMKFRFSLGRDYLGK